jgi:hypothetical protein
VSQRKYDTPREHAEKLREMGLPSSIPTIKRWIGRAVDPLPHYKINERVYLTLDRTLPWIERHLVERRPDQQRRRGRRAA